MSEFATSVKRHQNVDELSHVLGNHGDVKQGDVDMKSSITLAIIIALAAGVAATAPVQAKGNNRYVTKKAKPSMIVPASFTKGSYLFTCTNWGDCGNYKIIK
jgi:hypothetical protein